MIVHRFGKLAAAAAATTLALALAAGGALAGTRVEEGFYNGDVVHFLQPAVFSADPNGGTFACFGLGPDLSGTSRTAPAPTLYVILNDAATEDHCDGDATLLRHDHVLSTAPGHAGYTGSWTLMLAVPGPNFDAAAMPYTSVSEVLAGVAAGELALVDPGVRMIAPVVGSGS
jgi:hypothetical protein